MKLKVYLDGQWGAQVRLAEACGISQAFLSLIVAGKRTPSLGVARKINRATKGKVRFEDLLQYVPDGEKSEVAS